MNIKNYRKAMLVITFVELGESNSKMFDEIQTCNKAQELGFSQRTEFENKKFMRKWLKDHKVKLGDFKSVVDTPNQKHIKFDKNGVPIIVERKIKIC